MSGKLKNADRLVYILIGVLLAYVYKKASAAPANAEGVLFGHNYNLLVYAGSLLMASLLCLLLTALVDRAQGTLLWSDLSDPEAASSRSLTRRLFYIVYIAVTVSVVMLLYQIYANEDHLYPEGTGSTYLRHQIPHPLYFGLVAALSLLLFFSLRSRKRYTPNRLLRLGLIPIFALFSAGLVYCPNILKDTGAGTLHIHAVTNSIYNVLHGAPYGDLNCSIYGHYALFLAPLAKVLGGDLNGIMLSISFAAFVAFAAAFYAAHKLVHSNVVYVLTLFGVTGTTTLLTRRGQYFQVNPLRLLFPGLALALIAYSISHTETKRLLLIRILEYILGTCALMWNFETGLFSVLLLMAVRVYRSLYTDPLFSRHTFRTILGAILYGGLCAFSALMLVGVYNLASGGEFGTLRQFVYPLFSGTYNVNHLRMALPSVTYLYFFEILLFLLSALLLLRRQTRRMDGDHVSETVAFAVSLSGLLSLTYFMNRAVYGNMSISHMQTNLLLGYWAARALRKPEGSFKERLASPAGMLSSAMLAILFSSSVWMAAEGGMYLPVAADYRVKSVWKTASLEEASAQLAAAVPENTFAFGTYVPELYASLKWDTGCYMTDWSDINELNRGYAYEEAAKHSGILTSLPEEEYAPEGYVPAAEIPVGEYTFRYLKRS